MNRKNPKLPETPDIPVPEFTTPQSGQDYSSVQNPWSTQYLHESAWDKLVHDLGFNSAYDKAEAQRKQNETEWNSAQQEKIRSEKYNSAAEVVDRENAAGLNPNLSGSAVGGGSSDMNVPDFQQSPALAEYSSQNDKISNGLISVISTGFSIATGMINAQGVMASTAGKKIANQGAQIQNYLTAIGAADKTHELFKGWNNSFNPSVASHLPFYNSMPADYRDIFADAYNFIDKSHRGKARTAQQISGATNSMLQAASLSPIYRGLDTDKDELFKPVTKTVQILTDAQLDIQKMYWNEIGKARAKADLSEAGAREAGAESLKLSKDSQKIMFEAFNKVCEALKKEMEKGNFFTKSLSMGLLTAAAAYSQNLLPSISIGNSSSNNWQTGEQRTTSSFQLH